MLCDFVVLCQTHVQFWENVKNESVNLKLAKAARFQEIKGSAQTKQCPNWFRLWQESRAKN
jgi:hypothetical protein